MKLSGTKKIMLYSTLIALVVIVSVLTQMIIYSYHTSNTKILPGVYINRYYVGGMTKDEAVDEITNDLADLLIDNNTKVVNGDIEFTVHASNIANIDIESLVDKAYNARRDDGNISYFDFIAMKFSPVNIQSETILDWQNIYNLLEMNQHLYYHAPVDASLLDYSFADGELKVVASPSENGFKLNIRETATKVQSALLNHEETVYAVMDVIEPEVPTDKLLHMSNEPITYSQIFTVMNNGVHNKISSDLHELNNLVEPVLIMPSQSISVKEFIGYDDYKPRTKNLKELHIPSIIFGCAMHLGLDTDEHHLNDYIVDDMEAYPYGQEAILGNTLDLVLTNNFSYPVILDLNYDASNNTHTLTCSIYYVESLEYTYIKSVIEEHGRNYVVKVYRVYANDTGGVLSRTLLYEHTYPIPIEEIEEVEEIIEQMG